VLAEDPTNSLIGMGGTQDNGTNFYSGSTVWSPILGGDGGFTAIDFTTPTVGYAESEWGFSDSGPYKTTNLGPTAFFSAANSGINTSTIGCSISLPYDCPAEFPPLLFYTVLLYLPG